MAVSASYDSNHYSAATATTVTPKATEPLRSNHGTSYTVRGKASIATTEIDDAGDIVWLVPVPSGRSIKSLTITSADLDTNGSPLLNADLVLRTWDTAGAIVDTVIYDSSGLPAPISAAKLFSAAKAGEVYQLPTPEVIPLSNTGMGHIIFKVVAAAATAAAGILLLDVELA